MTLLVVLTASEIVLLVVVLAVYLVLIHRRLVSINRNLARISFGVRAVETQTSSVGPSVDALNDSLKDAASTMRRVQEKTEHLTR